VTVGIRITWTANTEADINSYELERSDDGIVFTALVTITHDLGDPLVYDVTNRVFFYLDTTGLQNFHFYRIRAVDDASNKSAYSTPKQVGPPEPPLCVVFGVVIDADGTPNTDVSVKGTIVSTKDTKDGQIVDSFGITNKAIEASDRVTLGTRTFQVKGIDNPGLLDRHLRIEMLEIV